MAYGDLQTEILALLGAVTNIGQTHGRERWSDNWPDYLDLFKSTIGGNDEIRGWFVTREAILDEENEDREGAIAHKHQFVIRGIMGFDDSRDTETLFQVLVDAVMAGLDADQNLNGNAVDWGQGPSSARVMELRRFGQATCHYVEILWPVTTMDTFS